ncbi:unnamed protein product [Thelazia callipaeda]|uniref:RING-type domain-containing protein n=1 Tax=Thelazia callipaeda TaxID=103827 RepID=A0A0N5CMW3_THECL|nr:unnamed protein product [Thelazia callipaeda]
MEIRKFQKNGSVSVVTSNKMPKKHSLLCLPSRRRYLPVFGSLTSVARSYEGQERCSICLEEYKEGQELRVLFCGHEFHPKCVDPWLLSNRRCPLCQYDVVYKEYPRTEHRTKAYQTNNSTIRNSSNRFDVPLLPQVTVSECHENNISTTICATSTAATVMPTSNINITASTAASTSTTTTTTIATSASGNTTTSAPAATASTSTFFTTPSRHTAIYNTYNQIQPEIQCFIRVSSKYINGVEPRKKHLHRVKKKEEIYTHHNWLEAHRPSITLHQHNIMRDCRRKHSNRNVVNPRLCRRNLQNRSRLVNSHQQRQLQKSLRPIFPIALAPDISDAKSHRDLQQHSRESFENISGYSSDISSFPEYIEPSPSPSASPSLTLRFPYIERGICAQSSESNFRQPQLIHSRKAFLSVEPISKSQKISCEKHRIL